MSYAPGVEQWAFIGSPHHEWAIATGKWFEALSRCRGTCWHSFSEAEIRRSNLLYLLRPLIGKDCALLLLCNNVRIWGHLSWSIDLNECCETRIYVPRWWCRLLVAQTLFGCWRLETHSHADATSTTPSPTSFRDVTDSCIDNSERIIIWRCCWSSRQVCRCGCSRNGHGGFNQRSSLNARHQQAQKLFCG